MLGIICLLACRVDGAAHSFAGTYFQQQKALAGFFSCPSKDTTCNQTSPIVIFASQRELPPDMASVIYSSQHAIIAYLS
jgi:hypothetical protein